jgi:hypothetical protein
MARTQFPNTASQPMPGNVRGALQKHKLMDAYLERPAYQKDDYLKWIATAAGPTAKQQRLDQMVEELQKGGVFKGEPWTPPAKVEPVAKSAGNMGATSESKPAAAGASKPAAKAASKPAAKAASKPAAKAPAKPAAKK